MNAKTFLVALAAAVAVPCAALSQDYPVGGKPVRLVVPFPAGAEVFDATARMVAKKLSESLGVPVIVDNRPGAGNIVGNQAVASAAPDGHTLLYGLIPSLTMLPHQLARRPYDEFRDFTPITFVARSPLFLMAHPSVPAKNLRELVAHAKANPGKLAFASWQFGGLNQVYLEMLKAEAGVDMIHVPYKAPDEALKDLVEGRIHLMFGGSQTHISLIRAGKLNALAATGGARMRSMPDLPTFAEQGFSGYEHVGGIGIFGPGAMAPATVGKLNAELSRVLRTPDVVEFFVKLVPTFEVEPSTPGELGAQMRAQYDALGPIIRKLGIRLD